MCSDILSYLNITFLLLYLSRCSCALFRMATQRPMSDHVSCVVCMEQYNRTDHIPKLLPCQHTFCLACLLSLESNSCSMSIECPMCRSQHPGSSHDFTTNRVAMDIAEDLQQQASLSLSCSEHADAECVLVCIDCLAGICAKCVKKHKDHRLEDMDDAKALLRERFVDQTRKQQSALKTEMASCPSVTEITRAEDDIKNMCALLISAITEWQNEQLSIIGEIKSNAAKREQEMTSQKAKLEIMTQNDIHISILLTALKNKEEIIIQTPKGNTYNFLVARETILAEVTCVITSEHLVNSEFLLNQIQDDASLAMSPRTSPQLEPPRRIPAEASRARRFNQVCSICHLVQKSINTRILNPTSFHLCHCQ